MKRNPRQYCNNPHQRRPQHLHQFPHSRPIYPQRPSPPSTSTSCLPATTHQANLVYKAATGYGFFYLQNHNVDSKFMFDLAQQVFTLPLDEKMKYDMGTTGHYYGYKRSGAMIVDDKGNPDRSEFYNVSKDEVLGIENAKPTPHPDVVKARFEELQKFMRACHRVVTILVGSLGKSLGLPDGLLESLHRMDKPSCDQARVHARTSRRARHHLFRGSFGFRECDSALQPARRPPGTESKWKGMAICQTTPGIRCYQLGRRFCEDG